MTANHMQNLAFAASIFFKKNNEGGADQSSFFLKKKSNPCNASARKDEQTVG
jgi:hypothetical protein